MHMRSFFLVLLCLWLSAVAATAEGLPHPPEPWKIQLNGDFAALGPLSDREDHTLYKVSFECKALAALPQRRVVDNLVSQKTITTSHAILITNESLVADASGKIPLAQVQKALRFITPYSANGNNVLDYRKACPEPFVVAGTKPTYIVPIANYSVTNSP